MTTNPRLARAREIERLTAYFRRQGAQCNKQQPIVPVAGSELFKAAAILEALTPATDDDAVTPEMLTAGIKAFSAKPIVSGPWLKRALSNAYRAMAAARLEAVEEKG